MSENNFFLATISKKPDAPRILDVDLNSSPSGIELDSSQALGLELVVAGTEKGLLDRLMVPLHQGKKIKRIAAKPLICQ